MASFARGRISTHSVRDVRAAERRAAALSPREERAEPVPPAASDTFPWAEHGEPAAYEHERALEHERGLDHERGPDAGAYDHGRLAEPGEPAFAPGQVATERPAEPESRVGRHENDVPEPSER